jgi:hypothetical protein
METVSPPKKRNLRPWIVVPFGCLGSLIILGIIVLITPMGMFVAAVLGGQAWCEFRNRWEFSLHHARYEAIVQAISKKAIPAGMPSYFAISKDKDPTTLRVIDPERDQESFDRSNETQVVEAWSYPGGRLSVRICTFSMGHAGVYGLVYSSGPPEPGEIERSFGVGGHVAPVAPGWWRVSDYSQ